MTEIASAGQLRMSYARAALVIVPLVLFLGIASGVLSGSGDGNAWFAGLAKPAAMPPSWAFPLVWSILYVLIGLALAAVVLARGAPGRRLAVGLFVVQLALNLAWSPIFFAGHRVAIAFAVILLTILFTIATILAFARVRRRAAWAMLPYLAWLCFAAWLNHRIDVLNPDAATLAPGRGSTQVEL
jgi:tryptophan-rich sensory protein